MISESFMDQMGNKLPVCDGIIILKVPYCANFTTPFLAVIEKVHPSPLWLVSHFRKCVLKHPVLEISHL